MIDQPLSSKEIIQRVRRRAATPEQSSEWYKASRAADDSGGPCPVCGWTDGDGIATCFYSADLGAVTHQNSPAGAMKSMTPEMTALLASYDSMHNDYEHHADHSHCQLALAFDGEVIKDQFRQPHHCGGQFVQMQTGGWGCTGCGSIGENTAESRAAGLLWSHTHKVADHSRCVQCGQYWYIPHTCGGVGEWAGAYHIRCSGCRTEVRLWEHGIDYDVG